MSNKMLIDASHPEETRVVVTRGNRIEEFDFESEHKKQLKGNIYLARVTRVEPSLQAAFVEYGGNRHGFLAFSEIHPDYYQIPVADRLALIEAEEQAARQDNENGELSAAEPPRKRRSKRKSDEDSASHPDRMMEQTEIDEVSDEPDNSLEQDDNHNEATSEIEEPIELAGLEDAMEELPVQRLLRRDYKIQEVIKRRQILLVQVMKEERGNKGAALTTYLSLAGRYSVLMPNTARGGGISRKITNADDRKRLRDVVKELEVPKGMGVILRTAGANRTKAEVKRDYEYLIRLWENVRNLTLTSIAPALVYEEGNLIKRSIRDLYNKNITEILVAGEKGYREAKDFMRMLMPSHAKAVQPYRDKLPIFARNGIETQLDGMLQPEVSLKSGGYLVINQTEALVAIDVNSGRSTKEHSVEETAVQTNLEAAEEIARQLRLRDLAGLVIIDFIDMQDKRNIRAVEKRLKDCLKDDRARIQVGRISHFGLMEMSRQRIRASVLESTTQPCPHCSGTGYIRSESSVALHVIRAIEEYLLRNSQHNIIVRTPVSTALYVLNHKRKVLAELESRFGLSIDIEADDSIGNQHLAIYKGTPAEQASRDDVPALLPEEELHIEADDEREEQADTEEQANNNNGRNRRRRRGERDDNRQEKQPEAKAEKTASDTNPEEDRKRRRRRGRRGGRRNREHDIERRLPQAEPVGPFATSALASLQQKPRQSALPAAEPIGFAAPAFSIGAESDIIKTGSVSEKIIHAAEPMVELAATAKPAKRSRRKTKVHMAEKEIAPVQAEGQTNAAELAAAGIAPSEPVKTKRTRRKKSNEAETNANTVSEQAIAVSADKTEEKKQVKKPRSRRVKKAADTTSDETDQQTENTEPVVTSSNSDEMQTDKPKRMGWWQRKGFF